MQKLSMKRVKHPQFGPALPPQQLLQDLQIMKKMGGNFVRGSHYPQDQRFLDLCDEMGFVPGNPRRR